MKLKKIYSLAFLIMLSAVITLLILYPERYIKSSLQGVTLFAVVVLPSLFPFLFLTALLTRLSAVSLIAKKFAPVTKFLFKCPGISSYVYLMSVISGYPIGAKIIADLYENKAISSSQATKMSTFCSTSGPLFVIGSVGIAMLYNKKAGLIIYLCHILAGLLCGLLFRFYKADEKDNNLFEKKPQVDNILESSMYSSVISILMVGGFITVFFILADMLIDFNILLPLENIINLILSPISSDNLIGKYMAQGMIEGTKGAALLSKLSSRLVLPAICFIISFGGLSIITQQIIYLKKAKASITVFLSSKLLHASLSFILCFLLM